MANKGMLLLPLALGIYGWGGYKVYFYAPGTSTTKAVYAESSLSTQLNSGADASVTLDTVGSTGQKEIYVDGPFDFEVKDASDVSVISTVSDGLGLRNHFQEAITFDSGFTMGGVLTTVAGSVSAPGIAIVDSGTGYYQIATNNPGFAINGSKVVDYSATRIEFTVDLEVPDGDSSNVSIGSSANPDTGINFTGASDLMDFYCNGTKVATIDETYISFPKQVTASVSQGTGETISTGSTTEISWDTEDWDIGNVWTIGSPTRFTIPTGADGKYLVIATISFPSNGTGQREVSFKLNGATQSVGTQRIDGQANGVTEITAMGMFDLSAADYIEISVFQNSGGNLTLGSGNSDAQIIKVA